MTLKPVSPHRILTASEAGMRVAAITADACRAAAVPYPLALALVEQESTDGSNVFGRADASPFADYPHPVTKEGFRLYYWLVTERGMTPTGIGPVQITYAGDLKDGKRDGGYFKQMLESGMKPWKPYDNVLFGLRLVRGNYDRRGDWRLAFGHYNGGRVPNMTYAAEAMDKAAAWRALFKK